MIRTKEAIGITRELIRDAREVYPGHADFEFYLKTIARNALIQSEYLENTSRALVFQAEQLKADVETRLKT